MDLLVLVVDEVGVGLFVIWLARNLLDIVVPKSNPTVLDAPVQLLPNGKLLFLLLHRLVALECRVELAPLRHSRFLQVGVVLHFYIYWAPSLTG